MTDAPDLERRLLPFKAKGTPDEFWTVSRHRVSLADAEAGTDREKQHLALAALFAGRGFREGERDAERLKTTLELFRRAQSKGCFPEQLKTVESQVLNQVRLSGGAPEPETVGERAKKAFTDVAAYLLSDRAVFDAVSDDDAAWFDDKGVAATVRAGRGLFVRTGGDGWSRLVIRVLDRDDLVLRPAEYENLNASAEPVLLDVPSGVMSFGQPMAKPEECLEVAVAAGVYRVALHALKHGETWLAIAARTEATEATNEVPDGLVRYGRSRPGILEPGWPLIVCQ
jgi:hypothetical protein